MRARKAPGARPATGLAGRGTLTDGRPDRVVEQFRTARRDPALAVLEGFHAVKHAIRFGAEIRALAASDLDFVLGLAGDLAPDVRSAIEAIATPVRHELFEKLSPVRIPTCVVGIATRPFISPTEIVAAPGAAPVVLLENPHDLNNVGAAVRVAAAAGAAGVLTTGPRDPWSPVALRGAAGLHYAVPVARVEALALANRLLIAIDPDDGTALGDEAVPAHAVLAFGTERGGLSDEILDRAEKRIRIPMQPGVASMNLATAVAVMLYAWRTRAAHPP